MRSFVCSSLVAWCLLVTSLAGCEGSSGDASGPGVDAAAVGDSAAPDAAADTAGADVAPDPDTGGAPADVPAPPPVPTVAEMRAVGPYSMGVTTLALVDETRGVSPNGEYPGAATRALPTEVWYPAAREAGSAPVETRDPPLAEGGPFPIVVYNHGFMTRPRDNAGLCAWLASHGYVVAAPEFPLTNMFAPGGANAADVTNQPEDVRFVLDHLLALAADPESPLHGAVDGERVALIGVSLGGMTSLLTAFHEDFVDERVDGVAVMAPPGCFLPEDFFANRTLPLMVIHGDLDMILLYDENGPRTYDLAARSGGARYLLTIFGGTHTGFADAAASVMDNLANPDTIGCTAIGGNATAKVDALAPLVLSFGGDDYDTLRARCHSPCEDVTDYPPSQKATIQSELMFLGVRGFLDATLKDDAAARRFLVDGLPKERSDDVSLVADLPGDDGPL